MAFVDPARIDYSGREPVIHKGHCSRGSRKERELSGLFGVVPFRGVRLVEREEGSKALWMIPLCLLSELDQFLSGVEDVAPPDQWLCAAMLVMCVCVRESRVGGLEWALRIKG